MNIICFYTVITDFTEYFIRASSWISVDMAGQYKFPDGYGPYVEVTNVLDPIDALDTTFQHVDINVSWCPFHQYAKNISQHR